MLHQSAYFVERNLQAAGALPEKDYNIMDCFLIGAFVYLGSKIDDLTRAITSNIGSAVVDEDDCVEESKDINDADEAKQKPKATFQNVGYQ